jgi:hypothetical protein
MKKTYLVALAAASLISASAQDLTKDITIEREIHPTLRAASRLNSYPTLLQPTIEKSPLKVSTDVTAAQAVQGDAILSPANPGDAVELSPYNGYAALGYFPAFNLGASAGYRFINKPTSRLGAWLQYDGNSYKTTRQGFDDKLSLKRHTATIGGDYTHLFRGAGRLDINADYTYDYVSRPWLTDPDKATSNAVNLKANWSARRQEMVYFATANYSLFAFGNVDGALPNSNLGKIAENRFGLKGGVGYFITPSSTVAADADVDFLHYNNFNRYSNSAVAAGDGKTIGVVTLRPAYRYNSSSLYANIGLRLQYTYGSGKAIHISPDITAGYNFSKAVGAYINLDGGEHINNFASLVAVTPYLSPSIAYGNSHIPFTAEIGLRIGQINGISVDIHGGYAMANDWLMPAEAMGTYLFKDVNLRALHAGINARWKHSDLLTVQASYEIAPGSYSHAYYLNRDRAKHVAQLKVEVAPIEKLNIDASLNFRGGRSAYIFDFFGNREKYNLGNISDINLGADYAITKALTVFLRGENLLNRRARLLPDLQAQGIKGLVGVELKF